MKKNRKQIMFFIENKNITVYEYKGKKFDTIQDCGEDVIEYSEDFLDWFKNAVAYSSMTDELDYLIITDNSVNLDLSKYNISTQSKWDNNIIKEFNKSKLYNQSLILKNRRNKVVYKFKGKNNILEYTVIFSDRIINSFDNILIDKKINKDTNQNIYNNTNQNVNDEIQQNINRNICSDINKKISDDLNQNISLDLNKNTVENNKSVKKQENNKAELKSEINLAQYYKKQLEKDEKNRNKNKIEF